MSEQISVSRAQLVALVNSLSGGYPNPDDPGPPVPWWPWWRRAGLGGPWPDPWRWVGPQPEPELPRAAGLRQAAINPQPLPPEPDIVAALTRDVVDHVAGLYDTAAVLPEEISAHVRKHADARFAEYVDDFCGTERLLEWLKHLQENRPRPSVPLPHPYHLRAVIGAELLRVAPLMGDAGLRERFQAAGSRLVEMSLV